MFAKKRKLTAFYIATACFLGLLLINRFVVSYENAIRTTASFLTYPVLLLQEYCVEPIQHLVLFKKKYEDIAADFDALQQKYNDLQAQHIALEAERSYYKEIEEIITFKKGYESEHALVASVIFKQLCDQSQFFLIDKGSMHGIQQHMVAVHKNCLLGQITDVYPLYSKVVLITDQNCKVAAYCENTGASGVHVGGNNAECSFLHHVSHLLKVTAGDKVISSGDGLVFPRGFALGMIKTAAIEGLYYAVTVEPLIAFDEIKHCVIMQKSNY